MRLSRFVRLPGGSRVQARYILVACGVMLGLVVALAAMLVLARLRADTMANSERELKNLALVLSAETDRGLQAAELLQLGIIDYVRLHKVETPDEFTVLTDGYAFHQFLKERVAGLLMIDAIALIDMHGRLLNTSLTWPAPPIDLGDRDFVRALLADGSSPQFISVPLRNRLDGAWSIVLATKVTSPTGRTLGVVGCTFNLDYFESLFSRISMDAGSSFALYRRDGMLLARYPHADSSIGRTFSATDGFGGLLDIVDRGSVQRPSMVDGAYRVIVSHSLEHYPLLIAAGNTVRSILRPWHKDVRILGVGTLILELMTGGGIVLGVRQLRSRERLQATEAARLKAQAELTLASERDKAARELHIQWLHFDMALDNMRQGLCMYDDEGRILVANHRFAEMFQLPCDLVVPGIDYDRVTEMVVSAGLVSSDDMLEMRERRRAMVDRHTATSFDWKMANGRTLTVTHQPMPDGWLTTYEDVTERCAAEAKIIHMAQHDALTDLPNRFLFHRRLEDALSFARRGRSLAVLCLDLDQFKAVNDTLGHPVGDALLRAVAERLDHETRQSDTVARLGGDEFAIVQNAVETPSEAAAFARRIIDLLEQPFDIDGHHIVIGTSIGIAFAPQDGMDADRVLRCADLALYRAKADGRGVCRLFQAEMDAQMQARRLLELDLRRALQEDQLELYYQPLVDLRRQAPCGLEALLRWRHPKRGLVLPGDFIPLAEEVGLIVAIGEWVLKRACTEATSWPGKPKIAVNLSPAQFRNRNLAGTVAGALRESGLEPDRLELEITESVMFRDTEAASAVLHELRALGVRIAMDDFGTGYSSLSYLRSFPFDRIKIDRSFVRELGKRQDCGAIVQAVTALSARLGMATTAEGVETQEQLDVLADVGCSEVQGHFFSPAVPAAEVSGLLFRLIEMMSAPARYADTDAEPEMFSL